MNTDKLKKVIQEAVPEIMELKFGCKIKRHIKDEQWINGTVISFNNMFKNVNSKAITDYKRLRVMEGGELKNYDSSFIKCKILGRDITLADVLLALGKQQAGLFQLDDFGIEFCSEAVRKLLRLWDLTKNFDDQSDELKQFLEDILVPNH